MIEGALKTIYNGGTSIIGDGSTVEFEFDFEFINKGDIFYQIGDNDPVRVEGNLGVITNNNSVIFDTAPENGEEGVILRQSNLVRQTDPLVGFSYDNLNLEYNNIYSVMQELKVNADGYAETLKEDIDTFNSEIGDFYKKGDVSFFNENNIDNDWIMADGRLLPAEQYDLSDIGYSVIDTSETQALNFDERVIQNAGNQFLHLISYFNGEYYFQEYNTTDQIGLVISKSSDIDGTQTIVNSDLNLRDIDSDSKIKFIQTDINTGYAIVNNSVNETIDLYRIINIGAGTKEFVKSYNYNIVIDSRAHLTRKEGDPNTCYFLYYDLSNGVLVDEVEYQDLSGTYTSNSSFATTYSGIDFFTTTCSANTPVFKNSTDFYFKITFNKQIVKYNISTQTSTVVYDYSDIGGNYDTYDKLELNGHNYITDNKKIFLLGYEYVFGSTNIDILILDENDNPTRKKLVLPRVEFGDQEDPYPAGFDIPYYLKKINNIFIKDNIIMVSQGRTTHITYDDFENIDSQLSFSTVDNSGSLNFFFGYFIEFDNDNKDKVYNVLTLRQGSTFIDNINKFNYISGNDGDLYYQIPNYTEFNRGSVKAYFKVK